jgi:hypothetical protein
MSSFLRTSGVMGMPLSSSTLIRSLILLPYSVAGKSAREREAPPPPELSSGGDTFMMMVSAPAPAASLKLAAYLRAASGEHKGRNS